MSEARLRQLCAVCLNPIHWYQQWVAVHAGLWVKRYHLKCWRKEQIDARASGSKVAPEMDDSFILRDDKSRPA